MSNPQMSNIPGAAVMTDTLDFVKNLWGSMSVPGLTAPTLSVDELDKKINDLKAVEAWLNLNMSMLRGSIQALEVQRGTIATLKSVGASMAAAVNQGADHKSLFESVPYASAFFHHATPAAAKQAPPAPPAPAAAPAAPAAAAPSTPDASTSAAASAASAAAAQMANPTVWWNLLQDQFKQAVSTAMTSDAVSGAAARATEAAAKFASVATGKPATTAAGVAKPAAARAAVKKAPAKRAAPKTKA